MIIRIKRKTLEQSLIATFILASLIFIIIGVSFTTNYVTGATNVTNVTVIAKLNVTNTEPNITAVTLNDDDTSTPEIDLTANGVTVVTFHCHRIICNAFIFTSKSS